jgi:HK97 family phage major capsid protein
MKKISELKIERSAKIDAMQSIVDKVMAENRAKDENESLDWTKLDNEVRGLDTQIEMLKRQEELNKRKAVEAIIEPVTETERSMVENFMETLKRSAETGSTTTFRADPILTSTNTAIVNKTVANSVDIITSPGEEFLKKLGVTFYTGLNGNFVVPSMAEDLATFAGENVDASSANMAPEALTLAARRVTHTQAVSRETLAQTNPAIFSGILQNLVNGVWNAVTNDLFDQIEVDASTQEFTATVAGLTYGDIVDMEAEIGGLNIGAGAYVTTPAAKAYLKQLNASAAGIKFAWGDDNTLNSYPAYGVPAANDDTIYFGDFSKTCVGQWGNYEIIVDPFTDAKKGLINLTIVGLFDTGVINKRALTFAPDVSIG